MDENEIRHRYGLHPVAEHLDQVRDLLTEGSDAAAQALDHLHRSEAAGDFADFSVEKQASSYADYYHARFECEQPMATRAYRELSGDDAAVWDRFYATFDFRPSMRRLPAITEPAPSVTWSLSGLDDDAGYARLDRLTEVVHAGLTALAGTGSILCLDWQHSCYRVWPSLVGPENIDPPGQPGWPLSPYPDGAYHIYLAEDFRFGTFGHPWEPSLCVFGGDLLDLVEADLYEVLGQVVRRDGRQVPA
ncbi:DUF2716 domain-containing protein [Salinispora tropica]|uniref:DUF2716 domain-containing protein n=1 Tax=Salinispora tropica (strain ATCC BAA-916 / DSM 44818 / JCM 13857 / NBRC 105044 / CNB-440) TaxID=369723 RepID=A4X8V3_SALTO|nr:DUF2716 domain-containing protein [Salinispora tropica]ABP55303.1 hypothetical protein Strop_2863 [Salinispora tropica CNB-440]